MAERRMGIMALLLCVCLCLFPCRVLAASTVDAAEQISPDELCSLTITYQSGGMAFAQLPVKLYRIAEVSTDFQYTPVPSFADAGLTLNGVSSVGECQVKFYCQRARGPCCRPRFRRRRDNRICDPFRSMRCRQSLPLSCPLLLCLYAVYFFAKNSLGSPRLFFSLFSPLLQLLCRLQYPCMQKAIPCLCPSNREHLDFFRLR